KTERWHSEGLTNDPQPRLPLRRPSKLPDKAIDVIDEAGARSVLQPVSKRRKTIRPKDIEEIIARMARIPPRSVSSDDKTKLKSLEDDLKLLIFGQDDAIGEVASAIKLGRSGLGSPDKPTASFLFAGPTGVGKTELSKALAAFLFDDEAAMIRVDMSEYMEKHAVARLIGAPPGYVGYDEGGALTEAVRRRPYQVILFDEVEKAHPD
ncbi:MAG: AAA family ATPase, partial [Acidimicrobiales bacterium]|nr:AAA family ATPase [Acidimicrobiales bacterium]